jgi:hypothetical protein
MSDDTIADLKQFIATTVRQEVASPEDRLDAKIEMMTRMSDCKSCIIIDSP